MHSFRIFSGALLLLAATAAMAKVDIKLNVTDGQTVSGVVNLRATVQSEHLVTSVEFYVNDDLRNSDESTPYEYSIDTVAEKEGPIKVRVAAYTSEGESAKVDLKLNIDNEVSKGADFHVDKGMAAIEAGKWEDAIVCGRIALKAKEGYIPARMLLARANFHKGILDAAQKFCEGVLAEDPSNSDALDLNSAIALRRAFGTLDRGDRNSTLDLIRKALKDAASSRNKVYDARIASFGEVNDSNLIKFADLGLQAGRFSRVAGLLEPKFQSDPTKTSIANRYIYALMRGGKMVEASKALGIYMKRGKPDAIGYALNSISLQYAGRDQDSLSAERQAVSLDASDITVRAAQSLLAQLRGNVPVLTQLTKDLARDEGQRYEVLLMESTVFNIAGDYTSAKDRFESAVLAEPAGFDAYVLRSNQLIGYSLSDASSKETVAYQRQLARVYLEAALEARPESFEALTGLSILEMIDSKFPEAMKLAEAATKAGPEYAAGYYTYALTLAFQSTAAQRAADAARSDARKADANQLAEEAAKLEKKARDFETLSRQYSQASDKALATSKQLDPGTLGVRGLSSVFDAWKYFAIKGRTPLLIPPQY